MNKRGSACLGTISPIPEAPVEFIMLTNSMNGTESYGGRPVATQIPLSSKKSPSPPVGY